MNDSPAITPKAASGIPVLLNRFQLAKLLRGKSRSRLFQRLAEVTPDFVTATGAPMFRPERLAEIAAALEVTL